MLGGRLAMVLMAGGVMAGAVAAFAATDRPRLLLDSETARLIGGASGCDGNCVLCGVLDVGEGCGQLCFGEPGEICLDPWTEMAHALPASDSSWYCDPSFPVGDPCVNGELDIAEVNTVACSCQAGICTADYNYPLSAWLHCQLPGCVTPAP